MTRGSQKFTSFFFFKFLILSSPHPLPSFIHPSILSSFAYSAHSACDCGIEARWSTDTNCYSLYTGIKIQVKKTGKGKKLSYEVICCFCVFFPPYFAMIMTLSAWIMHSRVCPPPPFFLTAMSFFMPLQKHNVLPPSPHFPLLQERYSLRCSWTFLCYILTSGSEYW